MARAWLITFLHSLHLKCVSWEEVIGNVETAETAKGAALRRFYEQCLRFNGPTRQTEPPSA